MKKRKQHGGRAANRGTRRHTCAEYETAVVAEMRRGVRTWAVCSTAGTVKAERMFWHPDAELVWSPVAYYNRGPHA